MKKYLLLLIILPFLAGCQNEAGNNAEFNLGNMNVSALENNTKYFIVTPFQWEGEEGATLKSIQIVNSQGEGINATFYIGDSLKKTGLYVRDEIGEKEKVKGYELNEEQTLIMETRLSNVEENTVKNLKFTYELNGEEYEKVVEWNTLSALRTEK